MTTKKTTTALFKMKEQGEKISMLTCYDYTNACIMDSSDIDMILVGDSLGMTMQGYDNTLPVTMEEMIVYGRSVVRACKNAFVIMDMPFMSYQISVEQAVENAGRLIKETNANAVKLEGGSAVVPQIKAIVDAGIPVCAHIGMTPQSVNIFGGFKVQGRDEKNARRIFQEALKVQEAGAFMVVLECVPPKLAALITESTDMITIGIGAGNGCDGQVLVYQDMLGMFDTVPKFVRRFADIGAEMSAAFKEYNSEVKLGTFPSNIHSYVNSDCTDDFLAKLKEETEKLQK